MGEDRHPGQYRDEGNDSPVAGAVSKGLDSDPGFRYRDGVFAALRSPVHTGMAIVAMGRAQRWLLGGAHPGARRWNDHRDTSVPQHRLADLQHRSDHRG